MAAVDRRGRRSANEQRRKNDQVILGQQALVVADEVEPLDASPWAAKLRCSQPITYYKNCLLSNATDTDYQSLIVRIGTKYCFWYGCWYWYCYWYDIFLNQDRSVAVHQFARFTASLPGFPFTIYHLSDETWPFNPCNFIWFTHMVPIHLDMSFFSA